MAHYQLLIVYEAALSPELQLVACGEIGEIMALVHYQSLLFWRAISPRIHAQPVGQVARRLYFDQMKSFSL